MTSPNATPDLHRPVATGRLRVLLAEDEALIAMTLGDLLHGVGVDVAGPASTVRQALTLIESQGHFHGALLDLSLGGEKVYPVAEELNRRGVPFAFLTGYGKAGVDPAFSAVPVLTKPFSMNDLCLVLEAFRRAAEADTH